MLAAVREIGQLRIKQEGLTPLEVLVEDPDSNGSYKKVIAIVLKEQAGGRWSFEGVELEDYDKEKIMRYLYRSGAANGADLTPTARLSGKPETTFDNKILGWFNILGEKHLPVSDQERDFLAQIKEQIAQNADYIRERILKTRDETPNKTGIVVTLKFKQDGEEKYIGDFPVFAQLLLYQVNEKGQRCAAKDKICSICGQRKDVVIGNLDTYAFYTLDKIGYITGGFKESQA
ncbi:MAG: TM1802 family CRISPR-associated protein, partial [Caldicoprobacter sp.]|uniref:TM1802 family CRISPR-associated protein n=1 Tax=Caldicoprobacter sp. TaxID=2004500 RepID=UPI0039C3B4DD